MAIQFRLPEDVREKHNLPEWVVYDPDVMMLDEAIELEDLLGVDPFELQQRLVPSDGRHRDLRAWKFVIWKAAVHAGADISYGEFNLDLFALRVASASGDDAGPKEPTPEEDPSTPASLLDDSSVPSTT